MEQEANGNNQLEPNHIYREIQQPGQAILLTAHEKVVDEMNYESHNEISLVRNSMILCGMIPDLDGVWKISQLTSELQLVVEVN